MHIDTAYDIAMSYKSTFPACPHPAFGLVSMSAYWTLATRSSFGAREALDAGLFTLVGEIINILAVFPLRHALVVMASFVLLSNAMRIADEERANLLFFAKLDDLPSRFMAQITHSTFDSVCHLVPGTLEFLPTAGVLLTSSLFFGNPPVSHVALAFETANATS